jgi:spore maturation protein CgeB
MRVLVVDAYYPDFLRAHYDAAPGLARRPYAEQLAALMRRWMGTADVYSHHLRALGHEAIEVVGNAIPLQAAWAREHGESRLARALLDVPYVRIGARRRLLARVLRAQVEAFDPEVVYVQSVAVLGAAGAARLRREGRLLVAQVGSAPPPDRVLSRYDLLTTSLPHLAERWRGQGRDAEYLRLAFDARVLDALRARGVDPDPDAPRPHGAVFVGTVHPPHVHRDGVATLTRLAGDPAVELYGRIDTKLPAGSPIRRRHRGAAWGLDMYALLARSRVAVNRHGDVSAGEANNMRLYEATGVGALLVTERAPNLPDLFEPGREVVAYDGVDDLLAQVRRLRDDDEARVAIARAGQARTLRDHTYERRMAELAALLQARR